LVGGLGRPGDGALTLTVPLVSVTVLLVNVAAAGVSVLSMALPRPSAVC
jgi:hypothetical protein